ncbi:MAG TPA: HAMP domain-containing sensor histidine kinase [Puia sp.]|nr:HAMP domain-containing sensor histidine kinase [Puia sp.]
MNPHTITPVKKMRTYRASSLFSKSLTHPRLMPPQPGQFGVALAHEVRNPLSNINLAVEMLRSTIREGDQQLYLDIISRSSSRISTLVTDLLGSCQPDEMGPERCPVHLLLDEVLEMTRDRISLKNISVRKDYTTLDCKILVNKQKIKLALTNVIINAIDAMPSKRGVLTLVTRCMNEKCIIEIKDNGIGIPKGDLERIFQPYFTGKAGGMGLGLSTTLKILQSSQADILVQSEEGKGTSFMLTFNRLLSSGKC